MPFLLRSQAQTLYTVDNSLVSHAQLSSVYWKAEYGEKRCNNAKYGDNAGCECAQKTDQTITKVGYEA